MWGGGTGGNSGNPWTPPPPPTLQQPEQWSFNPNHYTDVPNNQVDWAALAQQWIILKEVNTDNSAPQQGPPGVHLQHPHHHQQHHHHHHMMPNIRQPPPMSMSNINFQPSVPPGLLIGGQGIPPPALQMNMSSHSQAGDIIGEAPMDMDLEPADHLDSFSSSKNGNPLNQSGWKAKPTNWFAPENNNPWSAGPTTSSASTNSNEYRTPTTSDTSHVQNSIPNIKKQQQPAGTAFQNFPAYQDNTAAAVQTGYETAAYAHKGGYWSTSDNSGGGDGTGMANYSASAARTSGYSSDENSMSDFEAAKRKALPAWIREGLEKMEREKHKKEEMVKLEADREEMRKRRLAEEQNKLAEDEQKSVTESKWSNSRGGSSDEEDESHSEGKKIDPIMELSFAELSARIPKEDREEAMRLAIRRASTLLLCRITDAEILEVATEAYARAKAKSMKATSTMQVRKLGALASLSRGPLGLTGYGSDSEESNASKSDNEGRDDDEPDSEEELIAEIERKKRLWELKRLETEREKEPSRSRSRSRGPSPHQESPKESTSEESHQINSHVRDKREVEKPNVTDGTSGEEKTIENRNGRRGSTDSNSRLSRRDIDAKNDKSSGKVKEESENSNRKWEKSRSKSPRKDRKRRSRSKESRSRHRSPSSSRHRTKRSRSRSQSSSRHRRRRSRSRSSDRKRRGRSTLRNRRRNRSRSQSNSRDRQSKSSKKRSRSRDRKRSKSRSKDRSKSKKEDKSDKVKSKSKSDSSSKEKDKHGKKRSSKSRSRSVSSSESSRHGKNRKKKHKKRTARSKSRSLSSTRSRTSAKVSKQ